MDFAMVDDFLEEELATETERDAAYETGYKSVPRLGR